jgi:hypothetical protein
MLALLPITFDHPIALGVALAMLMFAAVVALLRRPSLPATTWALSAAGATLIALAAGLPHGRRDAPADVAVMIDVSPSTRSATFRDPARLSGRISQLLGPIPYRMYAFSGDADAEEVDEIERLPPEVPADETILSPPADAKAILLFSDVRLSRPATAALPRTYVAVDPALDRPGDGRIERLELTGIRQEQVELTVVIDGSEARTLEIAGARDPSPRSVGPGRAVVTTQRDPSAKRITARLNDVDAWPENDSLEAVLSPPAQLERWWVTAAGAGNAPPGARWRTIEASALSGDPLNYLSPSIIVLDNVPADAISQQAQQRLQQYVHDLGGGLLILGGEHAFGAGGYSGSTLDALSPLSSAPPRPTTHWILLADASGSMAAPASPDSGQTRWQAASEAMTGLIRLLPPDDLLGIGSFARVLRWWSNGRSVRATMGNLSSLPPRDLEPRGPTNLQAALEQIAGEQRSGIPTELLILSDADADIDQPRALAERLAASHVRVHLLATAALRDESPLRAIVDATGGKSIAQPDAARWASDLKQLLRAAAPGRIEHDRINLSFDSSLTLPPRELEWWNRTWPKEPADVLATGRSGNDDLPLAALRRDGLGRVVAAGFQPIEPELSRMIERCEQRPRDPRFSVTWTFDPDCRVALDAIDRAATQPYLNGMRPTLQLRRDGVITPLSIALVQTAPGRFEVSVPRIGSPRMATLIVNDQVIDRTALPGRYPREYELIGNDRAAMRDLAERSGGQVIEPDDAAPLTVRWPPRPVDLTSITAIAGAALVALGLIWWRRNS